MVPFNACYQAILQAFTFVETIGDLETLPPARITLNDYASLTSPRASGSFRRCR